jgi:hypothetical protein
MKRGGLAAAVAFAASLAAAPAQAAVPPVECPLVLTRYLPHRRIEILGGLGNSLLLRALDFTERRETTFMRIATDGGVRTLTSEPGEQVAVLLGDRIVFAPKGDVFSRAPGAWGTVNGAGVRTAFDPRLPANPLVMVRIATKAGGAAGVAVVVAGDVGQGQVRLIDAGGGERWRADVRSFTSLVSASGDWSGDGVFDLLLGDGWSKWLIVSGKSGESLWSGSYADLGLEPFARGAFVLNGVVEAPVVLAVVYDQKTLLISPSKQRVGEMALGNFGGVGRLGIRPLTDVDGDGAADFAMADSASSTLVFSGKTSHPICSLYTSAESVVFGTYLAGEPPALVITAEDSLGYYRVPAPPPDPARVPEVAAEAAGGAIGFAQIEGALGISIRDLAPTERREAVARYLDTVLAAAYAPEFDAMGAVRLAGDPEAYWRLLRAAKAKLPRLAAVKHYRVRYLDFDEPKLSGMGRIRLPHVLSMICYAKPGDVPEKVEFDGAGVMTECPEKPGAAQVMLGKEAARRYGAVERESPLGSLGEWGRSVGEPQAGSLSRIVQHGKTGRFILITRVRREGDWRDHLRDLAGAVIH